MIKFKKRNYILYGIGCILMFLMILIPGNIMGVKIMLFFSFLLVMFISLLVKRMNIKFSKKVLVWFFVYIGSSLFYTLLSVVNNNPYALNGIKVKVIEPFLIMFIICAIKPHHFNVIRKTFLITTLIVVIYNVAFFMCINNIILSSSYAKFFVAAYINYGGVNFGLKKFSSQSISWLMYLIPMYMSLFLISNDYSKIEKKIILICVIGGLMNAVLSMRTAFLLVIVITPLVLIIMSKICDIKLDNKKCITVFTIVIILLVLSSILFRNQFSNILSSLIDKVMVSFSSKRSVNEYGIVDNGGTIRKEQIADLLYTWKKKPILGWGDSTNSLNIIRSSSNAGSYEMNYFALLMQRGIIGFSLFWLQIFYILYENVKIIRCKKLYHSDIMSMMIGFIAFLIANATNPYLDSFDRLLIMFLPLALINMNENHELNSLENKVYLLLNNNMNHQIAK